MLGRGICGTYFITVMGERGGRAWCKRYIAKTPSMNASSRTNSFSHGHVVGVNICRLSYTGDVRAHDISPEVVRETSYVVRSGPMSP